MTETEDACAHQSDDALLRRFGTGDVRAARALSQRLAPRLLGFATRMLGDRAEAEDVVQETFLRLWTMAPDWRPGEARVSTWAYTVAGNLCTDRLRRRRPQAGIERAHGVPDGAPDAEARLLDKARVHALDRALSHLGERQRKAVILRHIEGLPNPEIARIMEISVEAVESLTARARRALARDLAPRKDELGYDDDGP